MKRNPLEYTTRKTMRYLSWQIMLDNTKYPKPKLLKKVFNSIDKIRYE